MVKEKGKSPIEEEADVVPEDKEQGKHEEVTRLRVVEPYRPPVPSPNVLPSSRPSLENS